MNRLCALLSLVALLALGCGGPGVRPPSPGRELDDESLLAAQKPEHEHYYVLIFGSESFLRPPRFTHTWATMVRTLEPPGGPPRVTEVATISWMPATLKIDCLRFSVERGVDLDLDSTMRAILQNKETVSLWGPYEVWQGVYWRFMAQKAFLDAGRIGYQCVDEVGEAAHKANGCNCFHALTDMDPLFDRTQYPLIWYGDDASGNIVRQIFRRPLLVNPRQTHDWLVTVLGLERSPITRRQYNGPVREFSPEALREEQAKLAPTTQPAHRPK